MNWQTPYGDPLLPTLLSAMLNTFLYCSAALAVAGFSGGFFAVLWHETRGGVAAAMKTLVGLMDAMGPVLPALAVLSALQVKSEWTVAMILGAMTWNPVAAFLKEEADVLSKAAFVQAAVMLGATTWQVLFKHVIPHIFSRFAPLILGMFASYVGIFGALGFLGVASDPGHSLGFMIYDAKSFIRQNASYFIGSLVCFLLLLVVPYFVVRVMSWHVTRISRDGPLV